MTILHVDNTPTEWELDVFAKSLDFFHGVAEQTGLIMTDERRIDQLSALHGFLSNIKHRREKSSIEYAKCAENMRVLLEAYDEFVRLYGWIIGWCAGGEVRRSELEALR